MKLEIWGIGKTRAGYLKEGEEIYLRRLTRYIPCQVQWLDGPRLKSQLPPDEVRKKEGQYLLDRLQPDDRLILLDERGRTGSSAELAGWMQGQMNAGVRRLVFVIGGAWGFSDELRARAQDSWSLSRLTFTHQMVRLIFLEQLYRAYTILHNEPYHNE